MSFLSVSTASAVWKKCIPVSFLFSRFLILKTFAETLWLAFPPFSHHFLIRNGRALRIFFSAKKFEEGTSESLYYLAIIPSRIYAIISVIKKLQYNFPKMRGGSKAVWNFSENSSDFVAGPFSYCYCSFSKYRVSQKKVIFKMMMMISLILRVLDEKSNV